MDLSKHQMMPTGDYVKSFDAFFGDEVNPKPVYLFRMPGDHGWTRIEGLASAKILATESRHLRGMRA